MEDVPQRSTIRFSTSDVGSRAILMKKAFYFPTNGIFPTNAQQFQQIKRTFKGSKDVTSERWVKVHRKLMGKGAY